VSEPGAIFGELSFLLDQPHTADVRALEASQFHVADAALLAKDLLTLTYIAMALAARVNNANLAVIELKRQLNAGEPHSVIVEKVAGIDANLVYAGHPLNPFMYIEYIEQPSGKASG
jgi:CRP/FNR family transcriptional regulator, cyclic AMP receptor protein